MKMTLKVFNEAFGRVIRFDQTNGKLVWQRILLDGGDVIVFADGRIFRRDYGRDDGISSYECYITESLRDSTNRLWGLINAIRKGEVTDPKGKALFRACAAFLRELDSATLHGPDRTFNYIPVDYRDATGVEFTEDQTPVLRLHGQPKVLQAVNEISRYRWIMDFDPKHVRAFELRGAEDPGLTKEVILWLLKKLHEKTERKWTVLGRHKSHVLFVDSTKESGHFMSVLRRDLEPRVYNEIIADASREVPVQSSAFVNKVAHMVFTSGRTCNSSLVIDLRGYRVYDEPGINGLCVAMEEGDLRTTCEALDVPFTSVLHIRVKGWLWKGTIVLASKYIPAGVYLAGLPMVGIVPDRIRLKDLILVDGTHVHKRGGFTMVASQITNYTRNDHFRDWIIRLRMKQAKMVARCQMILQSADGTHKKMGKINEDFLMDNTGDVRDSGMWRNVAAGLFGKKFGETEGEIFQKSGQKGGIISGAPFRGDYVFLQASPFLKDGDPNSKPNLPAEMVITQDLAEELMIGIGDIVHGNRFPALPHGMNMVRFRIVDIIKHRGKYVIVSCGSVTRTDGDVDGDKLHVTAELHRQYELGTGRVLDDPIIDASLFQTKALEGLKPWHDIETRLYLCSMGVRISDWNAQRASCVLNGWCNNSTIAFIEKKNPDFFSFSPDEALIMLTKQIKVMIDRRKKPVDEENLHMVKIPSKAGTPVDSYRRLEMLLSAYHGNFYQEIPTDDGGIISPLIYLKQMEEEYGDVYPFVRIVRRLKRCMDRILFLNRRHMRIVKANANGYNNPLDGHPARFAATVNYDHRAGRIKALFNNAALLRHLVDEFVPKLVHKFISERKTGIVDTKTGKAIRAFVQDNKDGTVSLSQSKNGKNSSVYTVPSDRIQVTDKENEHARISRFGSIVRALIPLRAAEMAERYNVEVPERFLHIFGADTAWYVQCCIEMMLLHHSTRVDRDAGWTFMLSMVSDDMDSIGSIGGLLAPAGESWLDPQQDVTQVF